MHEVHMHVGSVVLQQWLAEKGIRSAITIISM